MINYLFSRKFARPRFAIDFRLWRYLLKECLPLALTGIITIIYYQIDVVTLSVRMGNTAVGIYSSAHRLCDHFLLSPYTLTMSLFPLMSAYFKSSKDDLIRTYTLVFGYLLITAPLLAVGMVIIADKVILLIYRTPFADSSTLFQILIWSVIFGMVNALLWDVLVVIAMQKLIMVSVTFCAAVNMILNYLLIPARGHNGAASTTVVTVAVLFTDVL